MEPEVAPGFCEPQRLRHIMPGTITVPDKTLREIALALWVLRVLYSENEFVASKSAS